MGPFAAIAGAETAPTRKFGRHVFDIAALLRVSDILYNYRVWVVVCAVMCELVSNLITGNFLKITLHNRLLAGL